VRKHNEAKVGEDIPQQSAGKVLAEIAHTRLMEQGCVGGDTPGQVPPNWKQSMIVVRERYARERATPYINLHHLYITQRAMLGNGVQVREGESA
jgi:hypothetical protein